MNVKGIGEWSGVVHTNEGLVFLYTLSSVPSFYLQIRSRRVNEDIGDIGYIGIGYRV